MSVTWESSGIRHVRQRGKILPGNIHFSLARKVTAPLIIHDERSPSVHGQIKHSIRTTECLAIFRMIENRNSNSVQGIVITVQDFSSQDCDPF